MYENIRVPCTGVGAGASRQRGGLAVRQNGRQLCEGHEGVGSWGE